MFRRLSLFAAGAGLVAAAACAKKTDTGAVDTTATTTTMAPAAAVHVTGIQLGRAIGSDGRVASATDEFKPSDTIYASVATDGVAQSATLSARWTYQDGQVVDTTSRAIAPTGPAATEFHISKPSGFPKGNYKVEIMLNGQTTQTKDFKVGS